jgi:hypothetical protein
VGAGHGDQAAGACHVTVSRPHVELRHERAGGAAVGEHDVLFDQPDDVAGELRHLRFGQGDAGHESVCFGLGGCGVEQRAVLRFVVAVLVQEALAGELRHLLADELLLVEAVAQALLRSGGVTTRGASAENLARVVPKELKTSLVIANGPHILVLERQHELHWR